MKKKLEFEKGKFLEVFNCSKCPDREFWQSLITVFLQLLKIMAKKGFRKWEGKSD